MVSSLINRYLQPDMIGDSEQNARTSHHPIVHPPAYRSQVLAVSGQAITAWAETDRQEPAASPQSRRFLPVVLQKVESSILVVFSYPDAHFTSLSIVPGVIGDSDNVLSVVLWRCRSIERFHPISC